MASYTKNLELLKKDPVADGADTFNIETMLNENWDKIDEKVATGKAMKDHVTNQENPHKVTAEQVGAASSVHSHTIDQVEGLNTALSNKADLKNGQVPYAQMPHLTAGKTVYVATTGSDSNPGTQEAPFRTIQAAVNSLPKDLLKDIAIIKIDDGYYDEDVSINGFYNGGLDYGICLKGNEEDISLVKIKRINIRSNSAVVGLLSFTLTGVKGPVMLIGNSNVLISHVHVLPEGDFQYDYSSFAVVVGLMSIVRGRDLLIDANQTWRGFQISGAVMFVSNLAIKNTVVGMNVGDSGNNSSGLVLLYNQPTFEGNTTDVVINGSGSTISGLEGQ